MRTLSAQELGRVAVLMGGESAEREVSLESGKNVLAALLGCGVDAFAFDPKDRSLGDLFRQQPTRVFIILHGQPGEDGRYQGVFDLHGIPYTGTGMLGSALTLDKWFSKTLWRREGVPTPNFIEISALTPEDESGYQKIYTALYPHSALGHKTIVVKPANEGSSLGISMVKNGQQWGDALGLARQYRGKVLAEEYIAGDEYTVGVVGDVALPTVAIRYQSEFYDYAAKYTDERTQLICPGGLPESVDSVLRDWAIRAALPLLARGWYRADFIIDAMGHPYLFEINTAPGMTSHSLVPKAAKVHGWDYADLVMRIASLATFDPTH